MAVGPDTVRAELAEARLRGLEAAQLSLGRRLGGQQSELDRLRSLVSTLQSELLAAQQELARLREEQAHLAVDELVASIAGAIDRGAAAFTGRALTSARAEIKALLAIAGGEAGLLLAPPATASPGQLSTVSIELRPVPPDAADAALASGLAAVRAAILELQTALENRDVAGAAFAAASALAASPPAVADLAAALQPLVRALGVPEVADAAGSLGAPPSPRRLTDLAAALRAAAARA